MPYEKENCFTDSCKSKIEVDKPSEEHDWLTSLLLQIGFSLPQTRKMQFEVHLPTQEGQSKFLGIDGMPSEYFQTSHTKSKLSASLLICPPDRHWTYECLDEKKTYSKEAEGGEDGTEKDGVVILRS